MPSQPNFNDGAPYMFWVSEQRKVMCIWFSFFLCAICFSSRIVIYFSFIQRIAGGNLRVIVKQWRWPTKYGVKQICNFVFCTWQIFVGVEFISRQLYFMNYLSANFLAVIIINVSNGWNNDLFFLNIYWQGVFIKNHFLKKVGREKINVPIVNVQPHVWDFTWFRKK